MNWQDVVKTALVGTERQKLNLKPPDNQLGEVLARLNTDDVEANLLSCVVAFAIYQQAGKLSWVDEELLPEVCEVEDVACCSFAATSYLGMILSGKYPELLGEWFGLIEKTQKIIHPRYLPELLNLGLRRSDLRENIIPLLGKRGLWLAAKNTEWNYVFSENIEKSAENTTLDEQILVLKKLRLTEPSAALEQIKAIPKKESGEIRAGLLQALSVSLSMDDEPFLEAALDDKRKQVRDVAAQLLAQLPESRLVKRMTERVSDFIKLSEKGLQVVLPKNPTREMSRDGVDEAKLVSKLGSQGSLLFQILSCVPPSYWSENRGKTPEELIMAVDGSKWEVLLLLGWTKAALRYQDVDWAGAILGAVIKFPGENWSFLRESIEALLGILPQVQREELIGNGFPPQPVPEVWGRSMGYTLLANCRYPWSEEFSRRVLEHLAAAVLFESQRDSVLVLPCWVVELKNLYPYYMSPCLYDEAFSLFGSLDQENLSRFLGILKFRYEMIKAFGGV